VLAAISVSDPFVELRCPGGVWKLVRGPTVRVAAVGEPDARLIEQTVRAARSLVGRVEVKLAGDVDPERFEGSNVEVEEAEHGLRDDVNVTVVQGPRGCVLSALLDGHRVYRLGFTDLDALHDHLTSLGYPPTFKASATLVLRSRSVSLGELFPAWVDRRTAERMASSLLTPDATERLLETLTTGAEDVNETPTGRLLLSATQAAWLCEGVFV